MIVKFYEFWRSIYASKKYEMLTMIEERNYH
jgi:hypothetical protein